METRRVSSVAWLALALALEVEEVRDAKLLRQKQHGFAMFGVDN